MLKQNKFIQSENAVMFDKETAKVVFLIAANALMSTMIGCSGAQYVKTPFISVCNKKNFNSKALSFELKFFDRDFALKSQQFFMLDKKIALATTGENKIIIRR